VRTTNQSCCYIEACSSHRLRHANMARIKITEAYPASPRRPRRCFTLKRTAVTKRQPAARATRLAGTGVTYLTNVAAYHAQVNVKGYKKYAGKIALGRYDTPDAAQHAVQLARTWLISNGYNTRLDVVQNAYQRPCARLCAHIAALVAGRVRRWVIRTHPEVAHKMPSGLLHM
jgi:hypothetical protein